MSERDASLTRQLIGHFKQLITEGALEPGCKLPPERSLSEQLGVSRTSLRHALKVLEIMGVLNQRVGDGTYLSQDGGEILKESLDFLIVFNEIPHQEILEARLIVEPQLAARAAERATSSDLALLKQSIDDLETVETLEQRVDVDSSFHETIFDAAGNQICKLIFTILHRALLESMRLIAPRVDLDRPLQDHKLIYQAIYDRDPKRAYESMFDHLKQLGPLFESPKHRQVITEPFRPLLGRGEKS